MINAMKKQTKQFLAGLLLSILIPAFIGGQFLLTDRQEIAVEQYQEQNMQKATTQEIDMEKAFSIVP